MSSKPNIAVVIGSARPTRFADKPAQWILKRAQARDDITVELVDLRDHPLPFFDEIASNMWMPSQNPEAVRWQQTIARFDGYIFVVELVDLRDHPLPFFDEIASNMWMPSQNPEAVRWQQTIARFDGYIFVV